MAYTQQQAQAYYQTLTPEQKAAVDATGGPTVEWLTAAVQAGVPDAMSAAGENAGQGWRGGGGGGEWDSARGAKKGAEWVGKRKPTPDELRQYSWDQGWGTDDYGDISNSVLQQWIANAWDVNRGGFFTTTGKRVDKPTDSWGQGASAEWVKGFEPGGEWSNYTAAMGAQMRGEGGGGGNAQAPTSQKDPYEALGLFGSGNVATPEGYQDGETQFKDLQRALEDKFLGREDMFGFENGRDPLSGLGTDRYARTLTGGGLWWGSDKDMFKENAAEPTPAPSPQPSAPQPVQPAAIQSYQQSLPAPSTPSGPYSTAHVQQNPNLQKAMYRKFPAKVPWESGYGMRPSPV